MMSVSLEYRPFNEFNENHYVVRKRPTQPTSSWSRWKKKRKYIIWLPLADYDDERLVMMAHVDFPQRYIPPIRMSHHSWRKEKIAKRVRKVFFFVLLFFAGILAQTLVYGFHICCHRVSRTKNSIFCFVWSGCVSLCVLHDIQCYHVLIIHTHTKMENNFRTILSSSKIHSTFDIYDFAIFFFLDFMLTLLLLWVVGCFRLIRSIMALPVAFAACLHVFSMEPAVVYNFRRWPEHDLTQQTITCTNQKAEKWKWARQIDARGEERERGREVELLKLLRKRNIM